MAKKEKKEVLEETTEEASEEVMEEVEIESAPSKTGSRSKRWEAYVANYMKESPVKGAAKEKRGEFSKIPDSFK